jgi:DNA-binding Lrp family transcriptional regulator
MLTNLEKKIISAIQDDIPITARPFKVISENIGISETEFLKSLQDLCNRVVIRRLGSSLRHQ